MAELDALDPIPEELKLTTGFTIEFERLRARQFFKLLRIVTNGALPQLANTGLFSGENIDEGEFTVRFVGLVLMAIPEAENETIDFIRSMGRPVGLIDGRKLNKQDEERNIALWLQFDDELDNPELDDLVSIIEAIVKREAADIQALGKRLASMFKLAQKTGQVPATANAPRKSQSQTVSTELSSEDSPEPSTSSPASTAGRRTTSATSRSARSASPSTRSRKGASTPAGSASNG